MAKEQKYRCGECANRGAPLCRECTYVQAPDGAESAPSHYVRLCMDRAGEEVKAAICRCLRSGGPASGDALADIIGGFAACRLPVPLAVVIRYNNLIERARRKAEGEEACR